MCKPSRHCRTIHCPLDPALVLCPFTSSVYFIHCRISLLLLFILHPHPRLFFSSFLPLFLPLLLFSYSHFTLRSTQSILSFPFHCIFCSSALLFPFLLHARHGSFVAPFYPCSRQSFIHTSFLHSPSLSFLTPLLFSFYSRPPSPIAHIPQRQLLLYPTRRQ